jgi:hypothetical protein
MGPPVRVGWLARSGFALVVVALLASLLRDAGSEAAGSNGDTERDGHVVPTPGLSARDAPAIAWTGKRLFVFGGVHFAPANRPDENLANDGGLVNPRTGEVRRLPASPFRPRLSVPVAVAVDDTVVVVGISCKALADEEYGFICRRPARYAAAQYDRSEDDWTEVPIPAPLLRIDGAAPDGARVGALGATSNGRAVFEFGAGFAREYWAYAPKRHRWTRLPDPGFRPESACLMRNELVLLRVRYEVNGMVHDVDPSPRLQGTGKNYVLPTLAVFDLAGGSHWNESAAGTDVVYPFGSPPGVTCLDRSVAVVDSVRSTEHFRVYETAGDTWSAPASPPPPAVFSAVRFWTGTELVFLPTEADIGSPGFAYRTGTNSWRLFENPPAISHGGLWNGSAIVGYAEQLPGEPSGTRSEAGVYRYVP